MGEQKMQPADTWVTVYEPADQVETAVIVSLLQDAGFQTFVKQETIGVITGLSLGDLSAAIQVPSSSAEAAREFLAAHFAAVEKANEDETEDEPTDDIGDEE